MGLVILIIINKAFCECKREKILSLRPTPATITTPRATIPEANTKPKIRLSPSLQSAQALPKAILSLPINLGTSLRVLLLKRDPRTILSRLKKGNKLQLDKQPKTQALPKRSPQRLGTPRRQNHSLPRPLLSSLRRLSLTRIPMMPTINNQHRLQEELPNLSLNVEANRVLPLARSPWPPRLLPMYPLSCLRCNW